MFIKFAPASGLAAAAFICAAVVPNGGSLAAAYKTLYSFCPQGQQPCPDGSSPAASLVMDPEGNLYGTTQYGGINCVVSAGCGTVFKLMPNPEHTKWTEEVLYSFCEEAYCADGAVPVAGLVRDKKSGKLFGTTPGGGADARNAGVVFELTPSGADTIWTEKVLHSFCAWEHCADGEYANGALPQTGLIMDEAGNLYGMTNGGGGNNSLGVAFQLKPDAGAGRWSETVLYRFCKQNCPEGSEPMSGLIQDGSGNLYGTTLYGGGPSNAGVAFELMPGVGTLWKEVILHDFCSRPNCADGEHPVGSLVLDTSSRNLYGSADGGGQHQGGGIAFQLSPRGGAVPWTERIVHSFGAKPRDGYNPPATMIIDASGNLYGTTPRTTSDNGAGVVFELTPNADGTWTEHTLHNFCYPQCADDGADPAAGLIMDKAGNLHGTTSAGGSTNNGTVFEVTP